MRNIKTAPKDGKPFRVFFGNPTTWFKAWRSGLLEHWSILHGSGAQYLSDCEFYAEYLGWMPVDEDENKEDIFDGQYVLTMPDGQSILRVSERKSTGETKLTIWMTKPTVEYEDGEWYWTIFMGEESLRQYYKNEDVFRSAPNSIEIDSSRMEIGPKWA